MDWLKKTRGGNKVVEGALKQIEEMRNAVSRSKQLAELLNELLEHGQCFLSAVELDHGFDGEEWEKRVRAALEQKP